MKKKVNGKMVDITNMDLFEAAFHGKAMGKPVSSSISDKLTENSEFVNKCIEVYSDIYEKFPSVLRDIENKVKYAAIAMLLREELNETLQDDEDLEMWINNALFIRVDEITALKFAGDTWGIVRTSRERKKDNTDIELYQDEVGYKEYAWAVRRLIYGYRLDDFYEEFMPEFVKACNNSEVLINWEVSRMLDFGIIPNERVSLNDNRIIDIESGAEYMLDIFSTGMKATGEEELVINLTGRGKPISSKQKYAQTYDFEIYEKRLETNIEMSNKISRMKKANLDGFAAVFEIIVGRSIVQESLNIKYSGLIINGIIVYQVGNQIYICRADTYTKPVEIGKNVDIYGYSEKYVYLVKRVLCDTGIYKESIYALNPTNMQIKLCKIQFV